MEITNENVNFDGKSVTNEGADVQTFSGRYLNAGLYFTRQINDMQEYSGNKEAYDGDFADFQAYCVRKVEAFINADDNGDDVSEEE